MYQRKLQRVGGGTFTVSVPKDWAEDRSLSAGSTVTLFTHIDGSLVVRADPSVGNGATETTIRVESTTPEVLRAELAGALEAGFDTVSIEAVDAFTDADHRAIEEVARELVGIEVTEQTENAVTVRNLLDASDVAVPQSVVQLQFVSLAALRQARRAVLDDHGSGDGDAVQQIQERAAEADRLQDLFTRWFNRSLSSFEKLDQLGFTRPELFDYYTTAGELGEITSRSATVVHAAGALSARPLESIARPLQDLFETIRTAAKDAVTAKLSDDRGTAHDVLDRCEEAGTAVDHLDGRLSAGGPLDDTADTVALVRVIDSLAQVVDAVRTIAAATVRSVRRTDVTEVTHHELR